MSDCLGRGFHDVDVRTSPANGRLLAWLSAHGEVLSRRFDDDAVIVHCRIPAALLGRITADEAEVVPHAAVQPAGASPPDPHAPPAGPSDADPVGRS